MANVFVSHAGVDTEAAVEIGTWLRDVEGHEIFLDRDLTDGIRIGEDWAERLQEQLRWADAVVCLLSEAYAASSWCTAEAAIASSYGSRVLPLTLAAGANHPLLKHLHHYPFWSQPDEAKKALGQELFRLTGSGRRGWSGDASPFPGLAAFTAENHRAFFGRDADIRTLLNGVRSAEQATTAVTLVVGPSGCGKSSLVAAGLMPAISDDPRWCTLDAFKPGTDPLSTLVDKLVKAGNRVGLPWRADDVSRLVKAGGLPGLVTDLLVKAGQRERLLVVVDQFEELLTRADAECRKEFVDVVLCRTAGGAVQVVGTMRPEFLDVLQADPAFAGVTTSEKLIWPLGPTGLRSVVEGPARLAGIGIEDGLVDRIVEDTGGGDALPLLAYTLAQLAEGVTRRGTLTHKRYDQLEGVQGALVQQAGAALANAVARGGRTEQAVLRELLRLVAVDGQDRATRLRLPTAALSDEVQAELAPFVERRILVTGEGADGPTIDVAHEAVLTAWPPLAEAIGRERGALRARDAVDEAARRWVAAKRPKARLWERGQLATALHDLDAPSRGPMRSARVELSDGTAEFLRQSVRRDRIRRGRLNLVLAALLVVALVAAVVAGIQTRIAEDQSTLTLSRSLVAQAEVAKDIDDRTALQLGVAAHRLRPDDTVPTASLIQTLAATPYTRTLPIPSGASTVAFAGRLMAIGSVDGLVRLWDTNDPLRPRPVAAPLEGATGAVYSVEFSHNGRTLAVAGGTGKVTLWDVTAPDAPVRLPDLLGHTGIVHGATFSPDDRTLATVGFDGKVLLWDVAEPGRPSQIGAPLTGHTDRINTVVFSPDGRTLATGGFDAKVLLWDVTEGTPPKLIGTAPDGPTNAVWTLAWSGATLAAASADGTIRLWNADDPRATARTGDAISLGASQAYAVAFAPDSPRLAVGGTDRDVTLWDFSEPAHPRRTATLTGHGDYVYALAFRDDATVVSGSADGTAVVWDLATAPTAAAVDPAPGVEAEVNAIAATSTGVLVSGTADGRLMLADTATGRVIASVASDPGVVRTVAVTPDGRTLAVGGDAGVALWDIAEPAAPRRLADVGERGRVYSVAVSGDGQTLATGGDDTVVRLWDITEPSRPTPRAKLTDHTGRVFVVAFGGTRLAAAGADNRIILWDVHDPTRPTRIGEPLGGHAAEVYAIALTHDGATMAAGGRDGSARLWDFDAHGQPQPFGQQSAARQPYVLSLAFAGDGRTMAAGYADGQVALWDMTEPGRARPLGPPLVEPTAINALVFPPGPDALVTAARTTSTRRWDLSRLATIQADPAGQACAALGSGLDEARWATYLPTESFRPTCP